jgi:hypothetical protein
MLRPSCFAITPHGHKPTQPEAAKGPLKLLPTDTAPPQAGPRRVHRVG